MNPVGNSGIFVLDTPHLAQDSVLLLGVTVVKWAPHANLEYITASS